MVYIKQLKLKKKYKFVKKQKLLHLLLIKTFFLLYPKLSGMTGTGKTAEIELEKIYNLAVKEIPTAKKSQRRDLS